MAPPTIADAARLSQGGEQQPCRWLKDKYGVSWQIIPTVLGKLLGDKGPAKAGRAMKAMQQTRKIDIQGLVRAHERS
jgi:predicted 3-demethylubiquinone-9 3-methyltransferase (glyoxalase superfamily)